ncbi:MAG: site-specific integrase [Clostridia bacterium]|nr:site-specific integrase [Clostridia bacterium]
MSRKATTRNANGSGTIRQRKDGTWEARFTVCVDPGTGKQVRRSVYGKTQKEVRQKMTAAQGEIDKGVYTEPSKLTVGKWLDIWLDEYTNGIKENTKATYCVQVKTHIKPQIGAVRLSELKTIHVQAMVNKLARDPKKPLSPKSVKNVNGVLHKAMAQAVILKYIPLNPCIGVQLPKVVKKDIKALEEDQIDAFLSAIKGSPYETILKVDLFTGMRQGEIMGLTWDRIDFKAGTILVDRQMIHEKQKGGKYKFATTKTGQVRKLRPMPAVMRILQQHKAVQARQRLAAGPAWVVEEGLEGLVFTDENGRHFANSTLTHNVKHFGEMAGVKNLRFHDLRHTYAVSSIRAGDDIKTISSNLGHATVSITLDVYAHYTEDMKKDSADRMEQYAARFSNL